MKKTENLQLQLWEGTDYPNIMIPNNNMLVLDSTFGDLKVGFDTVEDELTEVQAMTSGLSNRITENAQAIEMLDDFDTKVKDEVYALTDITNDITTKYDEIYRVRQEVVADIAESTVLYSPRYVAESTGIRQVADVTKGVYNRNFEIKAKVNSSAILKDLNLKEGDTVDIIGILIDPNSTESKEKTCLPLHMSGYYKETSNGDTFIHFIGEKRYIAFTEVDSSGTWSNIPSKGNFVSQYRISITYGIKRA